MDDDVRQELLDAIQRRLMTASEATLKEIHDLLLRTSTKEVRAVATIEDLSNYANDTAALASYDETDAERVWYYLIDQPKLVRVGGYGIALSSLRECFGTSRDHDTALTSEENDLLDGWLSKLGIREKADE